MLTWTGIAVLQIIRWQSDDSASRDNSRSNAATNVLGAAPDASMAGQPATPAGAAALLASVAPHPAPASAGSHSISAGNTRYAAGDADGMEISTAAEQGNSTKPRLVLTLQDAAEEPAAVAVLAALYGVKPIPSCCQSCRRSSSCMQRCWQTCGRSRASAQQQ
jgi:hypothetical protein